MQQIAKSNNYKCKQMSCETYEGTGKSSVMLYTSFKIEEKNRTDLRFMFEIMQNQGLIYNNVRYVDYLNWIYIAPKSSKILINTYRKTR